MSGFQVIFLINLIVRIIVEMCNIDIEEVNSCYKFINFGIRRLVFVVIQYV